MSDLDKPKPARPRESEAAHPPAAGGLLSDPRESLQILSRSYERDFNSEVPYTSDSTVGSIWHFAKGLVGLMKLFTNS